MRLTREEWKDFGLTAALVIVVGVAILSLTRCAVMKATFGDPPGAITCTSCGPGFSCESGVCSPVEGVRASDAGR